MTTSADGAPERLLTAAQELFGERGYRGTTTRAIAERAGVNEVTLFRAFGTKQGLLRALGERWTSRMAGNALERLSDLSDTRARLRALAEIEVEQAEALGPVTLRLALETRSDPDLAEVLPAGAKANLQGLAEYLGERHAAGDLRPDLEPVVMAEAFFARSSSLVMARRLIGRTEPPSAEDGPGRADQLFELFWAGVRDE